jgi:hypothetical protein
MAAARAKVSVLVAWREFREGAGVMPRQPIRARLSENRRNEFGLARVPGLRERTLPGQSSATP